MPLPHGKAALGLFKHALWLALLFWHCEGLRPPVRGRVIASSDAPPGCGRRGPSRSLSFVRRLSLRVLALDIGEVRVGVAVCDPGMRVASPVCVLPAPEVLGNAASFRRVIEDWEPELLLCGLPRTLAGEEGPQAARIREAASSISKACGIPCEFTDERLSSAQAKRSLRESGMPERKMRGKVDMIAASLFLQAWLDERIAPDCER